MVVRDIMRGKPIVHHVGNLYMHIVVLLSTEAQTRHQIDILNWWLSPPSLNLQLKKEGVYTLMLTLNNPLELSSIKFTLYFHSKKHGHYCVFLLLFIGSLKLQFLHLVGRMSQHMPMLRYYSSMIGLILGC